MNVFVIGRNGKPLMPTTPRKARLLLKEQKAHVVSTEPFAIQLDYRTGTATQEVTIGVDPGQKNIGIAVLRRNTVIFKMEIELIPTMDKKKRITARAEYRKGRRFRNTEYREPKWKPNRVRKFHEEPVDVKRNGKRVKKHWITEKTGFESERPEGWLPPSIRSNSDHNIFWIRKMLSFMPGTAKLRIELGKFIPQLMINPNMIGTDFQRGPAYFFKNRKEYQLAKQDYRCAICNKKFDKCRKARAHHLEYISNGASDSYDDIILVCSQCHTAVAHIQGGELDKLRKKMKRKKYIAPTFMNVLYQRLREAFPNAEITYGFITSVDREYLGLRKTHANDAIAIAAGNMFDSIKDTKETYQLKQVRRKKRSLHEGIPCKGRKEKNVLAKRNRKNVPSKKIGETVFHIWDTVIFNNKVGYISGFAGDAGARIVDWNGEYIRKSEQYTQVSLSEVKHVKKKDK